MNSVMALKRNASRCAQLPRRPASKRALHRWAGAWKIRQSSRRSTIAPWRARKVICSQRRGLLMKALTHLGHALLLLGESASGSAGSGSADSCPGADRFYRRSSRFRPALSNKLQQDTLIQIPFRMALDRLPDAFELQALRLLSASGECSGSAAPGPSTRTVLAGSSP